MFKPFRRAVSGMLLISVGVVLTLGGPNSAQARVYSPRVVPEGRPDLYSMRTFAQAPRWRELSGDQRAWAIFEYLTDPRTGVAPWGDGFREGNFQDYQLGLVRDPVKILNVYGLAYCDVFGPMLAGLWEQAGFGSARVVDLPGWQHVTTEVFYADRWHYLDLDVRAAFRRPDGTLASLDEARRDASLWQRDTGPRFFPMDDLKRVQEIYRTTEVRHRYGVAEAGHTMDFVLRQGESFTRWFAPRGDRWLHTPSFHKNPARKAMLERPPRGPKPKHADWLIWTRGNGRFDYAPRLTSDSTDFQDGVYAFENVQRDEQGLTLTKAGQGFAVFEVRSPYVIVPEVGDVEKTDDDHDAAVLELTGQGVSVEVSTDNGITWTAVKPAPKTSRFDLSKQVAGRYGYLVKFLLKGKPRQTRLESFRLTTWVQVAPASLPALAQGTNRMSLVTGDHYGLPTRVVEVRPDLSNTADFYKIVVFPPDEYNPADERNRVRGTVVVRLSPPPGARIAWFSAGASFRTHQNEAAEKTDNSIAYAVDRPAGFQEIYRSRIPADQQHWHYNADREVRLDEPASTVYVRFHGDPALNALRLFAHCLDEDPGPPDRLTITHVWSESGKRQEFTTTLAEPGEYVVDVEGEPVNESVTLSIPSDTGS